MTEILITTWTAVIGILSGLWGVVESVIVWAGSVLYHLHTDAPRLEGLLIGVVLTWVLLRRDRHPLLRVLSSPLKLIVDILDLAWDQVVEVLEDSKETVTGWLLKVITPVKGAVVAAWGKLISSLSSVKERLSKKKDEETE